MRVVFVGAGDLTVETALLLVERAHEVIIIEKDRDKIEELSEILDCSFLNGDGSKPKILKEAAPHHADFLFCLSDNDQYNIIAALVGRSLGFTDVVVHIHDIEYRHICQELGLEDTIVPSKTIARYLADKVAGIDILELSSMIRGEARFMTIDIDDETAGKVKDIDLPEKARLICYYRESEFHLADPDSTLKKGDEAIILTHSDQLSRLTERFQPKQAKEDKGSEEKRKKR
ncbi:MAG: TrkA family potassium uptake protein [Desulfuromonadales bacterium]